VARIILFFKGLIGHLQNIKLKNHGTLEIPSLCPLKNEKEASITRLAGNSWLGTWGVGSIELTSTM